VNETVNDFPFCPHLRPAKTGQSAACGLVQTLAETSHSRCEVAPDFCTACSRYSVPTVDVLNPIVASLLTTVTTELLKSLPPDSNSERLDSLQKRAIRNIKTHDLNDPLAAVETRESTPCCYLGGKRGSCNPTQHQCHHPDHDLTTLDACRYCYDWSTDAGVRMNRADLKTLLPSPTRDASKLAQNWAVGVTTSNREQETLGYALDSLIRAGWKSPQLMVDGPASIPERFKHLDVTRRATRLGAWANFYLGLTQLFMRDPHADAFLMVQDDALFYDREDVRDYLQNSVLWPANGQAIISLYCPAPYTRSTDGWHRRDGRWVWGALAFIFPNKILRRFLSDQRVLDHRMSKGPRGLALVDVVIGEWATANGLEIWYPVPSLVQHIGHVSTIWPDSRVMGDRRANRFLGTEC